MGSCIYAAGDDGKVLQALPRPPKSKQEPKHPRCVWRGKQGHAVDYGPAGFGARHEASKCGFGDPYSVLRGTATLAPRFSAGIYRVLELFLLISIGQIVFVLESPVCASVFIDENVLILSRWPRFLKSANAVFVGITHACQCFFVFGCLASCMVCCRCITSSARR